MNTKIHLAQSGTKCLLVAALVGAALILGGCGGHDDSNVSSVTGKEVPPGSTPLPPPAAPPSDTKPNLKHP